MNLKKAIKVLEYHQKWRLGDVDNIKYSPKQITQALDLILKEVKQLIKK